MTPSQLKTAILALQKEIGPRAEIYVSLNTASWRSDEGSLFASVYPRGLSSSEEMAFQVSADEGEDLLKKLRDGWAQHSARHRAELIRKMALRIINITAENGECTDAALRGEVFTEADVRLYGDDACEEANRIAARGPFSIITIRGANAA